jgi:CrcB protein
MEAEWGWGPTTTAIRLMTPTGRIRVGRNLSSRAAPSLKGIAAMCAYLLVFLGGGIGTALRHAVNVAFARWFGTGFPWHTVFENLSGSLIMGLLAGYFAFKSDAPQWLRLFLTTGIIGGYTTFSAFSLDAALLWERDQFAKLALYVVLSVGGALAGVALGLLIARRMM